MRRFLHNWHRDLYRVRIILVRCAPKDLSFIKKDNKKERKVYTAARSSLENLSKNELKVFYPTILSCFVEYYKENPKEKYIFEEKAEI